MVCAGCNDIHIVGACRVQRLLKADGSGAAANLALISNKSAANHPFLPMQVNNAAAQRLFAGQMHVKMHMQQKGGGAGGGKAKAARAGKKAAGADGGAAAAAAGAGGSGGHASRRGAGDGAAYPHQQHQQQRPQAAQQQWHQPEDPIDLCDDDDEEEDGSNSLRVTVVMKALMDLNAYLRKLRGVGRAPFQTVALQRVRGAVGSSRRAVVVVVARLDAGQRMMRAPSAPQMPIRA